MSDDTLLPVPILLREARGAFARRISDYIAAAQLPELPINGPLILGGLHIGEASFTELVASRRRSLERFGTIDRLFEAGYLEGPRDNPTLSDLGHHAAHVIQSAVGDLGAALHEHLGDDGAVQFVKGLHFLIADKQSRESK